MQKFINDFNEAQQKLDLFSFWKKDLNLRFKLRQEKDLLNISLQTPADYYFIKRALYFGERKNDFFAIIFANLNNMFLINILSNSASPVINEFLLFLPTFIKNNSFKPEKLKYIISLYKDVWQEHFINISEVLDQKSCEYLTQRTANPGLLKILRWRLDSLTRDTAPSTDREQSDFSPLFGNKSTTIKQAIKLSQSIAEGNCRLEQIVELGDLLFKIGLIEDVLLLIMTYFYNNVSTDKVFMDHIDNLLRKNIPIYALLYHPANPYTYAKDLYIAFFPSAKANEASLLYLNLYKTALVNQHRLKDYRFFELVTQVRKIRDFRPDDQFIFLLEQFINDKSSPNLSKLLELAQQRLTSAPHESFIILEIIRFLLNDISLNMPSALADGLINIYLQLYNWVPTHLFINQDITRKLASLTDNNHLHRELDKILKQQNSFDFKEFAPNENFAINGEIKPAAWHDFLKRTFLGVI